MIDLVRQEVVRSAHTLVIKIGTNVLTGSDGRLSFEQLAHLADQIAKIRHSGRQVVIVSSGAIGAGLGRLGLPKRPGVLPELQAAAAIGQCHLMQAWDDAFGQHGFNAAQILLTLDDFNNRARYLNTRNTILQLLKWKVVPVINENDTVSVAEIRFGDNDQLAAMVTNLLRAPLLIILSVVDGLYRLDLTEHPDQVPIDTVSIIDDSVLGLAGKSTSGLGTGGMQSKLQAARIATSAGENVWIANGKKPDVLTRLMQAERIGTLLLARGESVASWKRWIGYTAKPRGRYIVDRGAAEALCVRGRSLLPVGVVTVQDEFGPGEVVALVNDEGREFARGLTNYSSAEARLIAGKPTSKVAEILPGGRYEEIIHRDNLVVL